MQYGLIIWRFERCTYSSEYIILTIFGLIKIIYLYETPYHRYPLWAPLPPTPVHHSLLP